MILMEDVSYYGTMMVHSKGDADGMVSGAQHTHNIPFYQLYTIKKQNQTLCIVSSVIFMCLEDRVSVFEIVLNPNPTS
jgi:phosphate acetyltransferase